MKKEQKQEWDANTQYSLYITPQSGPELLAVLSRVAVVQGWPLRGVPLYFLMADHYLHEIFEP